MPVFRWDIDKTYLETDFESLSGLWRAATEDAEDKQNTDGVVPLVHALQEVDDARMVFLSGSPKQMRSVLLEKFSLDGVDVDDIILKDSLGAIAKGRFSDVKNQFGHKLPSLVEHRLSVQAESCGQTEYLFGDDVEQDALIYLSYQLILDGRLQWKDVKQVMREGGALSNAIDRMRRSYSKLESGHNIVRGIFIRLTKHQIPNWMYGLMPHLTPVHTWSQAGAILWADGVIDETALRQICLDEGTNPIQFANLVQDLQFRSLLEREQATTLLKITGGQKRFFVEKSMHMPLTFSNVLNAFQEIS